MARVRHPNVLQIFDYGSASIQRETDDCPVEFIAMEYIPGDTLRFTMSEEGFYPEQDLTRHWLEEYFLPLLDGINLQIEPGERICLLGRNGTGKTTLLRLVNGDLRPDGGEIARQPGVRTALLDQQVPNGIGPGWVGVALIEPDGSGSIVRCRWRSTTSIPVPVLTFFLSLAVRLHLRTWLLGR